MSVISLYLDDNYIESIEGDAFQGMVSLQKLKMNDNHLVHLQSKVVSPLQKLETLDLADNFITTIEGNIWRVLPALVWLSLEHNELTTAPEEVFFRPGPMPIVHRYMHCYSREYQLQLGFLIFSNVSFSKVQIR